MSALHTELTCCCSPTLGRPSLSVRLKHGAKSPVEDTVAGGH